MTSTSSNPTLRTALGEPGCCPEFAQVSRRGFLKGGAALAGVSTVLGSAVLTASPAMAVSADSVLVVLSMRGAHDGLSLAVPYGDPVYYQARPRIAVPSASLLAKDGFFGLHPRLSSLMPLWNSAEMAVIHAAGLPVANRSHFAAMEELEDADPGSAARSGWLNRLVGATTGDSPLQGFFVGGGVIPTSLVGAQQTMASEDIDSVTISGDGWGASRRTSLQTAWSNNQTALAAALGATLAATRDFTPVRSTSDNTTSRYPSTDLARALSVTARMIRGDVGIQVLTLDTGEWDMHVNLGGLNGGLMLAKAEDLATSIAAFFNDLGDQRSKVTLLAFSEFGRRIAENANQGLDHGYGNAMYAFGAGVRGGRYYGSFPTLANTTDADLTVTTDYRNVLADVIQGRFGASIPAVFPGLARRTVGFMQGV